MTCKLSSDDEELFSKIHWQIKLINIITKNNLFRCTNEKSFKSHRIDEISFAILRRNANTEQSTPENTDRCLMNF